MKSKTLLALIFSVLAVSGALAAVRTNSENTYENGPKQNTNDKVTARVGNSTKDTDGDGVEDWREVIQGTDPEKKDTDGDGVPDSEQADSARRQSAGRNASTADYADELFGPGAEGDSATERFSKMFISKYFGVKDSKEPLTEAERAEVMEDAMKALPEQKINTQKYSLSNLNIIKSGSTTALKGYGDALGAIVARHSPSGISNEYALVIESLHTEDPSRLEPLDDIKGGYERIISEMAEMPVPESAAGHHLGLLNATYALSVVIEKMSQIYDEPIVGLHGLRAYPEHVETFSDALNDLRNFFRQKGVHYQQGDDGYMFSITI